MTTSKTRGSARRLGAISSLGSRTVRFRIPNISRRFTVHEDLICQTSAYFRSKLQQNRKPLALPKIASRAESGEDNHSQKSNAENGEHDQTECFVCHESLDPTTHDITFCNKCGHNVHEECIEQWKQRSGRRTVIMASASAATCPMCRAIWLDGPLVSTFTVLEKLDAGAVQVYLQWLYTDVLELPQPLKDSTGALDLMLVKCLNVAWVLDDAVFRGLVLHKWFTREALARNYTDIVHWTFSQGQGGTIVKAFILDNFMVSVSPGWFRKEFAKWPTEFAQAVGDTALEKGNLHYHLTKKHRMSMVRSKWMFEMEDEIALV